MKANELMIGDWVYNSFTNENYQIWPQFFPQVYHQDKEMNRDLADANIHPIPLTPEILEKNGFESDTNMFGLCDYELSESYILENRGDRFCFVKRFPGHLHSTFHIIDVKYVHQLQHALRLCGISKDITL